MIFFRSSITGNFRPFEVKPVRPGQQQPRPTWVIENNVMAWPLRDLVEDLMVRLQCSATEADEHAHAMPWHVAHDCPNRRQEGE